MSLVQFLVFYNYFWVTEPNHKPSVFIVKEHEEQEATFYSFAKELFSTSELKVLRQIAREVWR